MKTRYGKNGFTLIEVLITLAIVSIVMTAVISAIWNIQSTSTSIDQRTNMAMNSRGSIHLIENEVRLLGFNPANDMNDNDIMDTARGGFIEFNRNDPGDITTDEKIGIGLKASEDDNGGGRDGFADHGATSLVVQTDGTGNNLADNIVAIRFAYAFDDDEDGSVDLSSNNNVLWAIDSDGDGDLDTLLDTNDDGEINEDDTIGGANLTDTVAISKIRAVKVWLVVRSKHPVKGATENGTFVVGDQRYTPDDNFAHTLLTTTIRCRNMS